MANMSDFPSECSNPTLVSCFCHNLQEGKSNPNRKLYFLEDPTICCNYEKGSCSGGMTTVDALYAIIK